LIASVRTAYDTLTPGDVAAMRWLRENAPTGSVLINDGYADGGVWAPYAAGLRILSPRSTSWAPPEAENAVRANLDQLDRMPTAEQAACELGTRYLYRGAAGTKWEARHLPSEEELRAWPDLREVFSSDGAAVFEL